MSRKPEPSDRFGGPARDPGYVKRGEVWAQRISDGALRTLGIPPEPIPWIKPHQRKRRRRDAA